MLNWLRNLALHCIVPDNFPGKRRERLLLIISPYVQDWKKYYEIADFVREKAPKMYKFGEGAGRYLSCELDGDLSALCIEDALMKTVHFKTNPSDSCSHAYKLNTSSTKLTRKFKLRYIGRIKPFPLDGDYSVLSDLQDL